MDTKEYVRSHFQEEPLQLASKMGLDKYTIAQVLEIEEITLTIKLPKFISHSFMSIYPTKEESLKTLTGCLEEMMINKITTDINLLNSILSFFLNTGLKK